MKKRILSLLAIILVFFSTFAVVVNKNNTNSTIGNNHQLSENIIPNENPTLQIDNYTITMRDIADFLQDKKEHYPLSDEFIERYQQTSGGYIDNAIKANLVVDKLLHEPNQKWHFFDSWLYPTIEEGMSWDDSAKTRVYVNLKCPELLLWIYEACEVSPEKVKAAKEVAEAAKVAGTNVTTMAKNMRAVVSWEDDIAPAILQFLTNAPSRPSYGVSVNQGEGFTVNGLSSQYREGCSVSFTVTVTDKTKLVDTVKVNGQAINVAGGKYTFTMPNKDVVISVTLKDKPVSDNPTTPAGDSYYTITYDMGDRKTSKQLDTAEDIFKTFTYAGSKTSIIESVSAFERIYGGGYGQSTWVKGDMLKFGTTSVNGSLTLSLSGTVNCVKITGYVANQSCTIRVGDSTSSDWIDGAASDGLTTTFVCSEMNVANKETTDAEQVVTITIYFESTSSVTIATTNKKPLYITAIEFLNETN